MSGKLEVGKECKVKNMIDDPELLDYYNTIRGHVKEYDENTFFLKHIEKYNTLEEFYNHYVRFNQDVMVIKWEHNKWDYLVYPLEE